MLPFLDYDYPVGPSSYGGQGGQGTAAGGQTDRLFQNGIPGIPGLGGNGQR